MEHYQKLAAQEERRQHLIALMDEHGISCPELALLMDRKPNTVRCWRSGHVPINDHTLALIELALAMRAGKLKMTA